MATVQVTEANFEATVEKGIVLLDFWAEWCGPCRMFGPVFEAAAKRHPEATFGKVNTEEQPGLAAAFSVRAIPTLVILRDGIVLGVQPGMVPPAALDQIVKKVQDLDMDEVRKAIADAEAKEAAAGETAPAAV